MNGKIVSLILFFVLVSSSLMMLPPASKAVESVRVYVDPPGIVNPSVFFNVSVKVENVVDLAGVEWKLKWDPTVLAAVNITEVMFHEVTPQSDWDNIQRNWLDTDNVIGVARYSYLYTNGVKAKQRGYLPISGNHTMAIIEFQVTGVGNCSLDLIDSKLANMNADPIDHENGNGFFSNSVAPPPLPPSPIESADVLVYLDPHRVRNESLGSQTTFSVAVKLDSIANHSGMLYVRFDLSWNSTLLECVNATDVIMHEVTPENEWGNIELNMVWDNAQGVFYYYGSFLDVGRALSGGYEPFFGNHTIAVITFQVKDFGKCLLHLSDFRAASPPSLSVLLYATIDGYFANTLNGDVNCDNAVNLYDAILLAKSFGARPLDMNWDEDADVNGDTFVDIYDVLLLCSCFGHSR
jgi:hypothetical protein